MIEIDNSNKRQAFDGQIIEIELPIKDNEYNKVRAHSISYNVIRNAIKIIANKRIWNANIANIEEFLNYLKYSLQYLIYSLYGNENPEALVNSRTLYDKGILTTINTQASQIITNNTVKGLLAPANQIFHAMNNVFFNLRAGCAEWNSSVKENFDPDGWCYIDENGNVASSYNGGTDKSILFKDTAIPDSKNQGFYLLSKADGVRCHYMLKLVNGFGNNNIKFTISKRKIKNSDEMYIVSSSNQFQVIRSYQSDKINSKVYYYNEWWREF